MSEDEIEIGLIMDELYRIVSGPAGPRDWARQNEIFHPQARQIRTEIDACGEARPHIMSVLEYAINTAPYLAEHDFYESEISRTITVFGNIAHAWSAYEARSHPDEPVPERRGINSIQLSKCARGKWRIISMIWDNEREGVRLPG